MKGETLMKLTLTHEEAKIKQGGDMKIKAVIKFGAKLCSDFSNNVRTPAHLFSVRIA